MTTENILGSRFNTLGIAVWGLDTECRVLQAKLIVSSSYANYPIMANFGEHGFRAALSKPFRMHELISTIEKVSQN
jgi:hypothetical protein